MSYSRYVTVRQHAQSHEVRFFKSSRGARIAQIPLEAFPDFWAYAYLVFMDEWCVLIDTGSGFRKNNQNLEDGLAAAAEVWQRPLGFDSLTHILITHGHIDHFGGLPFVREKSAAPIGIHELDRHNLTHTEERLAEMARRMVCFLADAGVPEDKARQLVEIYKLTKLDYQPGRVDFTYEAAGMKLGPFEMLHVPGHSAGHVAIRLGDVLFCGDHVLSEISPHQAPEGLTLNTGLSHYLQSLQSLQSWATNIRLTLGGHNEPIHDLAGRIAEIRQVHRKRLNEILALLTEPHTIAEISQHLFGELHGYNVLLALEEAGAHVEYLHQRGSLQIANLNEFTGGGHVPIRFQTLLDQEYLSGRAVFSR